MVKIMPKSRIQIVPVNELDKIQLSEVVVQAEGLPNSDDCIVELTSQADYDKYLHSAFNPMCEL